MQIKKETVISVLTTSGEVINAGDTVVFNFEDKCCVGVYLGLSDRGALKFKGKICEEQLEIIKDETIVIYRNDNKVVALDKSTGEKAEAKCNPADEFDFRTGAKLAFNRLIGEDVKSDNGVREVKRKAKVGEYIKIVDAMPSMLSIKPPNREIR